MLCVANLGILCAKLPLVHSICSLFAYLDFDWNPFFRSNRKYVIIVTGKGIDMCLVKSIWISYCLYS